MGMRLAAIEKRFLKDQPVLKAIFKDQMTAVLQAKGITLDTLADTVKEMLSSKNEKVKYNTLAMLFKYAGFMDETVNVRFTDMSTDDLQSFLRAFLKDENEKRGGIGTGGGVQKDT